MIFFRLPSVQNTNSILNHQRKENSINECINPFREIINLTCTGSKLLTLLHLNICNNNDFHIFFNYFEDLMNFEILNPPYLWSNQCLINRFHKSKKKYDENIINYIFNEYNN